MPLRQSSRTSGRHWSWRRRRRTARSAHLLNVSEWMDVGCGITLPRQQGGGTVPVADRKVQRCDYLPQPIAQDIPLTVAVSGAMG